VQDEAHVEARFARRGTLAAPVIGFGPRHYWACRFIIWDRVISWSSASTCGFKGTRRGTSFAAQTTTGNAIQAVLDQGMQRAEVMIKGPSLKRDATLRAI
ncbi:hypothetical protein Goshw_021137, partial [Gossypium schwendimanii]|nr:hypothetical protein [Gossypium schwendimanii]